jgi:hypothetical protein
VASELAVRRLLNAVKHQVHQIESAQQRGRQINVLRHWQVGVVLATDRVGRSKNGRSGVESGDDASLGDRDGLLLHDFMEDGTSGL